MDCTWTVDIVQTDEYGTVNIAQLTSVKVTVHSGGACSLTGSRAGCTVLLLQEGTTCDSSLQAVTTMDRIFLHFSCYRATCPWARACVCERERGSKGEYQTRFRLKINDKVKFERQGLRTPGRHHSSSTEALESGTLSHELTIYCTNVNTFYISFEADGSILWTLAEPHAKMKQGTQSPPVGVAGKIHLFKMNTIYHKHVWTLKVEAGVVEASCQQQSMSDSVAEQGSVRRRSYLNWQNGLWLVSDWRAPIIRSWQLMTAEHRTPGPAWTNVMLHFMFFFYVWRSGHHLSE